MTEKRFPEVSPRELAEWIGTGDAAALDVLLGERHDAARIPGSVNVCVYEVVFPERVAAALPDRERTVVVCGALGDDGRDHAAEDAAGKLVRLGYADVRILPGGVSAWAEAGLPVEGDVGQADDDFGAPSLPPDGEYPISAGESVLRWTGRSGNGAHVGTAAFKGGTLHVRDGRLAGRVVVDMRSLANEDLDDPDLRSLLLAHLASDDFFWTERFPEAVFELDGDVRPEVSVRAQPNLELRGTLRLRGVARELCVPASVAALEDGRLALEAHFDLDRTAWGACYGCGRLYRFLGMHLVYDLVSIQLRLVAGEVVSERTGG